MKILCTFVLFFSMAAAGADFPFKKKSPELRTYVPSEVAETLRSGTAVKRNDLALELGILAPNPSGTAVQSNAPCVNFSHVEERPVTLQVGSEDVVLLAESIECDSAYIVVFDKASKSDWHHLDTVRLPARVRPPEITFAEWIEPKVSEIVVRHETTRDIGSAEQENFVVLKLLHKRMEVVLDTAERSELTLVNRSAANTDNLQQTQTSTFSLLKAGPKSAALYRILEKQVLTDDKTTITRYRVWSWDPELERFRSAPIDGGDVRPVPPPKKPAPKTASPAQSPDQKTAPKPKKPQ